MRKGERELLEDVDERGWDLVLKEQGCPVESSSVMTGEKAAQTRTNAGRRGVGGGSLRKFQVSSFREIRLFSLNVELTASCINTCLQRKHWIPSDQDPVLPPLWLRCKPWSGNGDPTSRGCTLWSKTKTVNTLQVSRGKQNTAAVFGPELIWLQLLLVL